ncbi:MAG: hypothetical protein KIPDCIKN_01196 [Haliscomenobacter sp.]|nr:hypothetical protein [Haliscomenobacter sp.]
MINNDLSIAEERPPVLGTWNKVYLFLLVFQAILLLGFYWFMRSFS